MNRQVEIVKNICELTLDILHVKSIPAFAVNLLLEGYESDSLNVLAGLRSDSIWEIREYLELTFQELQLEKPPEEQAGVYIICLDLNEIVSKNINPFEGLKRITHKYSIWEPSKYNFGELFELEDYITYKYSETTNWDPEKRKTEITKFVNKIIPEAQKYLNKFLPKFGIKSIEEDIPHFQMDLSKDEFLDIKKVALRGIRPMENENSDRLKNLYSLRMFYFLVGILSLLLLPIHIFLDTSHSQLIKFEILIYLVFSLDCFVSMFFISKRDPLIFVILPFFLFIIAIYSLFFVRPFLFIILIMGILLIILTAKYRDLITPPRFLRK